MNKIRWAHKTDSYVLTGCANYFKRMLFSRIWMDGPTDEPYAGCNSEKVHCGLGDIFNSFMSALKRSSANLHPLRVLLVFEILFTLQKWKVIPKLSVSSPPSPHVFAPEAPIPSLLLSRKPCELGYLFQRMQHQKKQTKKQKSICLVEAHYRCSGVISDLLTPLHQSAPSVSLSAVTLSAPSLSFSCAVYFKALFCHSEPPDVTCVALSCLRARSMLKHLNKPAALQIPP